MSPDWAPPPPCRLHRTARGPPRKVTYFEPVPPRLARNTIIESTFDLGRRFRCTIRPVRGEGTRACPSASTLRSWPDWRAGRNAVYQLARIDNRRPARRRRRMSRA
jgi:hypothetical protein